MKLFSDSFSRPLKKHLSIPETKGDPSDSPGSISPGWHHSSGTFSEYGQPFTHRLLLAQSNIAMKTSLIISGGKKAVLPSGTEQHCKTADDTVYKSNLLYTWRLIFLVCVVSSAAQPYINTVIGKIGHPALSEDRLCLFMFSLSYTE